MGMAPYRIRPTSSHFCNRLVRVNGAAVSMSSRAATVCDAGGVGGSLGPSVQDSGGWADLRGHDASATTVQPEAAHPEPNS
jgi:2-polyprenyl-3-methyl-5-hydroxy-6-metoxy-1,4-benzoquinol methylase